jgi:hypothetical protein
VKVVAEAQVKKMMSLFAGHKTAHGTHGEPVRDGLKWEIKKTAKTLRTPPTQDLWKKHLEGVRPIGIVPIDENGECVWGSIDIDEYDVDLLKVVRDVENMPLVPCKSKSGGLHLFLFTTQPVSARDMQSTLHSIAASIGRAGSEIFPKQTSILTEKGDIGNWMVMPYYGDTFGGKLKNQHGVKKTGAEMTLQEFISEVQKKILTPAQFEDLAHKARESKVAPMAGGRGKGKGKQGGTSAPGPFGDGPPCLQHMSTGGFPEGGRNNALFMLGLYLKKADAANWKSRLEQDNQTFMKPPLTSDEVTQVRKQLERKDYEYTCKNEPMRSHCDKGVCRTRKYGVGDSGNYPAITNIRKMNSDPAIWFVSFGDRRLDISTYDLLNYSRFQQVCAEKHSILFSSMKQSDWVIILQDAMVGMEEDVPPDDITSQGIFHEKLEEFLTNRARGTRREDMLSGRPYLNEEDSRHYFRMKDFEDFLKRSGVKDVPRGQLKQSIESLGGKHHQFNVKNKRSINCWSVPDTAVQEMPSVDPENVQGDEI